MDLPRLKKFYEPENQKLYNRFFAKIADFIKQGQQRGLVSDHFSAIVGAHMLHGAVDAVIRQYVYNPDFRKETKTLDTLIDQAIVLVFNGLQS